MGSRVGFAGRVRLLGSPANPGGHMASIPSVPTPSNEPVKSYAPGSPERASLAAELQRQADQVVEMAQHDLHPHIVAHPPVGAQEPSRPGQLRGPRGRPFLLLQNKRKIEYLCDF